MKQFLLILAAAVVFVPIARSQTATVPNYKTDFQLWNDTQIIVPLDKKKDWSFVIWAIGRFGNNLRTATDFRIGGLISKKMNSHVTLAGGYLYQVSNSTFTRRRYASRYIGMATFSIPLGHKFTFVNRDEVQYESRYSRPNAFVIRPRLQLKREVEVGHTKIEPFVSWEPFYDSLLHAVARYREQVGFTHRFSPKFTADFFYTRQDETRVQHTPAGTLNGFGTSFKISLLQKREK